MALLSNGELRCGGTLVSDSLVVTSGSCVDYFDSLSFQVLVGVLKLDVKDPNAQLFSVGYEFSFKF